jgi:hypothetical protein
VKDQYSGDVNDYRKYGILRALAEAGLSLGVCWMLTPDDGRTDGKHTSYLFQPARWRRLDPALFDALAGIVASRRCVAAVEQSGVLGSAAFFSEQVPDRAPERETWFDNSLAALAGRDLIFFDPDNGLEVASVPYGRVNSSKYLYWREVARAWQNGHSLLIYQHFPRRERSAFIRALSQRFGEHCPGAEVACLSTSFVAFFAVAQERHKDVMRAGLKRASRFAHKPDVTEPLLCG